MRQLIQFTILFSYYIASERVFVLRDVLLASSFFETSSSFERAQVLTVLYDLLK